MSSSRWSSKLSKRVEVPAVDASIAEIVEVCRRHNMSISHEDGHGSFVVETFDEGNIEWLEGASLGRSMPTGDEKQ